MNRNVPALSRRALLKKSAAGFGMVGLSSLLGQSAFGEASRKAIAPKAKRVIFLFLNGGPSHLDTFDPKPALLKHQGEQPSGKLYKKNKGSGFLPSPLKFGRYGAGGVEISESLPQMAKVADDLCVIRSMVTDVPNHEPALLQMHTGILQPTRPSLGSWALYGLGTENENLPGYVVLRPSPKIVVGPALWSNGFLPAEFQATSVVTKDMAVDKLVANVRNGRHTYGEQREQLDLISKLNAITAPAGGSDSQLDAQIASMETAYRMQMEATDAFDISGESERTKERYGDSNFGRSCLLARRLAERGVRFTTVYYTKDSSNQPWDTHKSHDNGHAKLCKDADGAAATLIADLKERGLLDDTLVIFGGEFGRTPYSQDDKKGKPGRDHHHTAFTTVLAGGGVKGGYTHGATDEFGMHSVENIVHVHDLHATILHLLGIDHEELTYRYSGRDFRLTDVYGNVVRDVIA